MRNIEVKLKTAEALGKVRLGASRAVAAISARLVEEIMDNITIQDRVDTGAMRASVFFELASSASTRAQSIAEATRLASIPGKKSGRPHDFTPDVSTYSPRSPLWGKVGISANYAYAQETGYKRTTNRADGSSLTFIVKGGKFAMTALDTVRGEANRIAAEEIRKAM